jgi:hypothetical protein
MSTLQCTANKGGWKMSARVWIYVEHIEAAGQWTVFSRKVRTKNKDVVQYREQERLGRRQGKIWAE